MFNWFDELKVSIENGLKTGIESAVKSVSEGFMSGIEGFFKLPETSEPFQRVRLFTTSDRSISLDGVSVEEDSWRIESYREKNFILFQVPEPEIKECVLLCRAQIRTANLSKPAKLYLSHQNTGGWIFSRSVSVDGTTMWHSCEVGFHFQKQPSGPGIVNIGVDFEGGGVVWLKDIELLQAGVG